MVLKEGAVVGPPQDKSHKRVRTCCALVLSADVALQSNGGPVRQHQRPCLPRSLGTHTQDAPHVACWITTRPCCCLCCNASPMLLLFMATKNMELRRLQDHEQAGCPGRASHHAH